MKTGFVVIGSGIAGMSAAIHLSGLSEVILISKTNLISGSTALAQGGIAAVKSHATTKQDHIADTLHAGLGINNKDAVELLVSRSGAALEFLQKNGVVFDETMHTEAGHSEARIWHISDQTGLYIAKALAEKVRTIPAITVLENAFAVDLLLQDGAVHGVEIYHGGEIKRIHALKTIMATGGAGQMYAETTNPIESTGDGIAMGVRAGAKLSDMEFVQFHPTALATDESPVFLLSEALRGEGAKVVNGADEDICNALLPRDELSRIIFRRETQETVYLSLRHKTNDFWSERFPNIFKKLQEYGLSAERDLIPILPAAHFFSGGLKIDLRGRTTVGNLSAIGEVACSGVHGANRLASNSLLEALVFSEQVFLDYASQVKQGVMPHAPLDGHFETSEFKDSTAEDCKIQKAIQNISWKKIGILRSKKSLDEALYSLSRLEPIGTETKNLLAVAIFVAEAAKKRGESLGCHHLSL